MFGNQYRMTGMLSVLVARDTLEDSVANGAIPVENAMISLRDPAMFAEMLLRVEALHQKRDNQELKKYMIDLKRGTHWVIGLAISVGTAVMISPFVNALLQPVVDEIFKRHNQPQMGASMTPTPKPIEIIMNDNRQVITIRNYASRPVKIGCEKSALNHHDHP